MSDTTTYYWRVCANNVVDWGQWSETWQFSTMAQPSAPDQVTLSSPIDEATRQKSNIVFQWDTPGGTTPYTTYQLEISTSTSIVYNNASLVSTSQRVSGLAKNTTYYWRVRAGNSGDWGIWSDEWQFTTK